MKLRDRVVLITGASEGIGAACAQSFRIRGARLALNGRSREKLSQVAQPTDLVLPGDLTDASTPADVIDQTIAHFGRIDVLVNNAGSGMYGPAAEAPLATSRALFDLNFFAPLAAIHAAVPYMRAQGQGMIINVGSVAGEVTLPWMPIYSASKSALGALSASLRTELKPFNIHVLHVNPGYVRTGFQEHAIGTPPERVADGKKIAISPERCAEAIARGVETQAREVITPAWAHWLIRANRVFPAIVESRLRAMAGARSKL